MKIDKFTSCNQTHQLVDYVFRCHSTRTHCPCLRHRRNISFRFPTRIAQRTDKCIYWQEGKNIRFRIRRRRRKKTHVSMVNTEKRKEVVSSFRFFKSVMNLVVKECRGLVTSWFWRGRRRDIPRLCVWIRVPRFLLDGESTFRHKTF